MALQTRCIIDIGVHEIVRADQALRHVLQKTAEIKKCDTDGLEPSTSY